MTKTQIGVVVIGILIGVAGYWAFMGGGIFGGTAYTCGDGTEFRLNVAKDRSSVTIHPIKNAAVFPTKTLDKVAGEVGTTFVGGSVVLFGKGSDLQLITAATSTVCKPAEGSTPIDWGA